jgi:signal transduction histidine kinase
VKINRRLAWQGSLIVLPVAILAGVALNFLREDKASIEQEARTRAEALAPELARRFGQRAAASFRAAAGRLEGVVEDGRTVSPPDYPRLPSPPDWPNELTPDQARLWQAAQDATYRAGDAGAARKALSSLADPIAPAALRANAELALLRIESAGHMTESVARRCVDLARRSRGVLTESGAPLPDIALLIALGDPRSVRLNEASLSEVARNAREQPSFLTPELLDAAEKVAAPDLAVKCQAVRAAWLADERTRRLLAALPRPAGPDKSGEAWVDDSGGRFLALSTPQGSGWRVSLFPGELVQRAVAAALAADKDQVPPYAAASAEIGGRAVPAIAGAPMILAAASGRLDSHPFTLRLLVASPESLYAGYRKRLWLTAGLILCAAATAFFGLASLWRGFRREIRLGEMKSNFVSSVSHELRAPIAAVRLMAESLESGRVDEENKRKEYFRMIVHECRRLSSLVENVLDFSRIDQGRKEYAFEPVDVAALARHTVALMTPCAAERQVTLSLADPTPEAAALQPCWDGQAVEQSLVNLLDNAIKHSPAGAVVKMEIEAANGGPVRLWVEDRGPGIPKEEQARIFDLFYRRGSELRRETQGVGIGLAIVKHVAEAHGGRVLLRSAPGEGSRFALELPLERP